MSAGLDFCMDLAGRTPHGLEMFREARVNTPVYMDTSLLRRAVRSNVVSFPSQIPVFLKDPPADMQWRVVQLFFVWGWSSSRIGARFGVQKHQIWKILKDWSIRALTLGYIQVIDLDAFALLCGGQIDVLQRPPLAESVLTPQVPLLAQTQGSSLNHSHREGEVSHAFA